MRLKKAFDKSNYIDVIKGQGNTVLIRHIITQKLTTQAKISKALGISRSNMSRFIKGQRNTMIINLDDKLCKTVIDQFLTPEQQGKILLESGVSLPTSELPPVLDFLRSDYMLQNPELAQSIATAIAPTVSQIHADYLSQPAGKPPAPSA